LRPRENFPNVSPTPVTRVILPAFAGTSMDGRTRNAVALELMDFRVVGGPADAEFSTTSERGWS